MAVIKTNEREYDIDVNQGTIKVSKRHVEGDEIVTGRVFFLLSAEEFRRDPDALIELGRAICKMGVDMKNAR